MNGVLRHIPRSVRPLRSSCLGRPQRRHAQHCDLRWFTLQPHLKDKYLEKYKSKLEEKAKQVGVKDINELQKIYKPKPDPLFSEQSPQESASSSPFPAPPPPPSPVSQVSEKSSTPPGVKTLSSFLDLEKTRDLPPREIQTLWRLRHVSDSNSLCATIPYPIYQKIAATARKHPQFILPLPREGQGTEIHFLQWTFPTPDTTTVLFTHLAEYKLRGEYAQPHTTVTHHLEFAKDKDLVLLQGSVLPDQGVSVKEGKWLLMCLQKFYGMEQKEERVKLLEQFSSGDSAFKVEDLVEEAEKLV